MVLPGLLAAVAAWAYTVSGVITDESGEPLSDATVRLLAARDSSFVTGGVADLDGRFSLAGVNKGKYIVEANYIG